MVAKSKHFEMENVDQGDTYHFKGRYITSTYFLLNNSFACVGHRKDTVKYSIVIHLIMIQ